MWGMVKVTCIYPLAERNQRRLITPKLRLLRAEAARPFRERRALALERLVSTLEWAGATVPYYKELFAAHRFTPDSVRRDTRYLEDLPYLTKDILREQGRRLVSEPCASKIVREQKTGSSTGLAATIFYDQEGLDWTAAQNIQVLEWGGKRRWFREAHLSTRFAENHTPRWPEIEAKKCFALHRRNIYTAGFDDAAQEQLIKDLRSARARFVQGHPSSMFALARYAQRTGTDARGLFDVFVSTGEMLAAPRRALIEEVLGVRVSSRYGACEFGVMAQEPAAGPRGEMLVCDSLVWPETAEAEGGDAGNDRELVFTNLRNPVMPLIRYRMGDLGRLEERADGWWITELTGRTHDSVEIGGIAYPTHYIQDILDRCGAIDDFQIPVRGGAAVELRLVTPEAEWADVSARVRAQFPDLPLRRIGADELVFVGVRGKFSYLLREAS